MAVKTDNFQSPDYFNVDELLTEEHKLIRESVRNYVKKEISPIIEDFAQRAEFPQQIVKQLGDLGCFGPTIPEQYGLHQLWPHDAGTGTRRQRCSVNSKRTGKPGDVSHLPIWQ
jgi:alkylation response protein AidB-like acyl-CoA dehydrogenase